jgi:hypothetical protein
MFYKLTIFFIYRGLSPVSVLDITMGLKMMDLYFRRRDIEVFHREVKQDS